MSRILLKLPFAILGNLIGREMGGSIPVQIFCGMIGCFLADLLISAL